MPDNVALVSSSVVYKSLTYEVESSSDNPFALFKEDPKKEKGKALLEFEGQEKDVASKKLDTEGHCVGVIKRFYTLVASKPGTYAVELDVLAPFSSTRKTGFTISIPKVK
jgi:hypothetical protein